MSGETPSGTLPPPAGGSTSLTGVSPCPHICITEVFIPNAGTNPVKQFVNLPAESAFRGSSSEHQDRLGYNIRVGVRFQNPVSGSTTFSLELVPDGNNAQYSPNSERIQSHGHYRFQPENPQSFTISEENSIIVEQGVSLTAAAGDTFRVRATCDQGHTHISDPIVVWRRIWAQEINMAGMGTPPDIQPFIDYFMDNHNLVIRKSSQPAEMEYMRNVGDGAQRRRYMRRVRRAYRDQREIRRKEPHVVAIAYAHTLATKMPDLEVITTDVSAPGRFATNPSPVSISIVESSGGAQKYLWMDIDEDDWFVSAHFVAEGSNRRVRIERNKFTPISRDPAAPRGSRLSNKCREVQADLTGLFDEETFGSIQLVVNAVHHFSEGLSFRDTNLICVATDCLWAPVADVDKQGILVHELGHKIGMVPDGTADQNGHLDALPDQYEGRGHYGSHCHSGLGLQALFDGTTNNHADGCVMYGSGARDAGGNRRLDFCTDCAQAVNKVDISNGWEHI